MCLVLLFVYLFVCLFQLFTVTFLSFFLLSLWITSFVFFVFFFLLCEFLFLGFTVARAVGGGVCPALLSLSLPLLHVLSSAHARKIGICLLLFALMKAGHGRWMWSRLRLTCFLLLYIFFLSFFLYSVLRFSLLLAFVSVVNSLSYLFILFPR